ncbi:hypothetical protein HanPI659440_Chr06g0229581 [Helianthus annuus]|nr:hypothetical protein HanPI659440_Chr06g0229581 [Helianthus annuus]
MYAAEKDDHIATKSNNLKDKVMNRPSQIYRASEENSRQKRRCSRLQWII